MSEDSTALAEMMPPFRYTPALAASIEQRWQDRWEAEGIFHAPNPAGPWADPAAVAGRERHYVLDMFPYPSGAGLHVGHPLGYIGTDVYARFSRMTGKNVLHALGYDAFGLPAEQYAVQTGQHPRKTTDENIATMRQQLRRLGLGHDSRRALATTDVEYVRWTQWMFLQLWNSWYDPTANSVGSARPISELAAKYACGDRALADGREWSELTAGEQRDVLDQERLAYVSAAPVNWCPGLGTVLSNEEVTNDGRSERGNFPVFKRTLRQWMLRISVYADRLIDDLDRLDWPEPVKQMQRNWIGRSVGAYVDFKLATLPGELTVFTTRPDTLFGATFLAVAPEHPVLTQDLPQAWPENISEAWTAGAADPRTAVQEYQSQAAHRSDQERTADGKKTGVFTGLFATNPVDGRQLPIFVADYVLMEYGTGAIMAVPAQDQRDWDFAEAYGLAIIATIAAPADWSGKAYTGEGLVINSASGDLDLNGLAMAPAKDRVISWLEAAGSGRRAITYRLRDWLFSRQRYWGEPFPVVFDADGRAHPIPLDQLPIELPDVPDYSPRTFDPEDAESEPEPPLGRAPDWVTVDLDLGDGLQTYTRETNTMPNWAGSCWYFLRYLDPDNTTAFCDPENEAYWLGPTSADPSDPGGVDLYVGGKEHAVLHLLYARFWHKVLFDLGLVSSEEPFRRYFGQGMIQAFAYRDDRGQVVPADEVIESADGYSWNGLPVTREQSKMGKSLKNVVTPEEMYQSYGADAFRIYEMSMGPLDASRPWETRAAVGSLRFLQRLWRTMVDEKTDQLAITEDRPDEATLRQLHHTIASVTADYPNLRFNTAVAKLIELTNAVTKLPAVPRLIAEPMVLLVAPLAPHIAEELWLRLGHESSLTFEPFPVADPAYLVQDEVTCVIQVQGKVRERIQVPPDINDEDLRLLALDSSRLAAAIAGQEVTKVIIRAPKLINFVIRG